MHLTCMRALPRAPPRGSTLTQTSPCAAWLRHLPPPTHVVRSGLGMSIETNQTASAEEVEERGIIEQAIDGVINLGQARRL